MEDLIPFFGRFHVVALHLPIGILALVAGLELYFSFSTRERPALLGNIWLLGTLAALVTSGLGYLLSLSGGYNEDAVALHQIWAAATTFIALIGWVAFGLLNRRGKAWTIIISGVQIASLSFAGHLGGNLTHGPEFLFEHAPNPVRALAGFEPRKAPRPAITTLNDADVFLDIVQPILEQRCTSCHNPSKTKGELLLDSYANIMKGGETAAAVVVGDLGASELSVRINLDPAHDDFMPSGGKTPLTAEQTQVLDWWIQIGAPGTAQIASLNIEPSIRSLLNQVLGQKAEPTPVVVEPEIVQAPVTDRPVIMKLEAMGFDVNQVSLTDRRLSIVYYPVDTQPISDEKVRALLSIRENLIRLNLGDCGLSDDQLSIVAQLTELKKLNIHSNPITDSGMTALAPLVNLEHLVLHSTALTDASLPALDALPKLKRAFLWGSQVTASRPYIVLGP